MADKGPDLGSDRQKHGLAPYGYNEVAAWPFADFVFQLPTGT